MKHFIYINFYLLNLVCFSFLFSSNLILANSYDTNGYRVLDSGILTEDMDNTINYSSTIYRSIIPLKVTTQNTSKICTGVAVSDNVVLTAPLCVPSDDVTSVKVIKKSYDSTQINFIQPQKIYRNSYYKNNNNFKNALVVLVFKEDSFSDFIEIYPGYLTSLLKYEQTNYNVTYIGFGGSSSEHSLSLKVKKATVNKIFDNAYISPSRIGGFESIKNGVKTTQTFIVEPADIGSPLLINGKVVGITSMIHTSKDKTTNKDITYPIWTYINKYSNPVNNNNYDFLALELHNLASIAGITPGIRMIEFFGMVKVLSLHPRYSYGDSSYCDNCNLKVNDTITGLYNSHDKNKKIYFISPMMQSNHDYLEYIAWKHDSDTLNLTNPFIVYKDSALPIQTIRYIWNRATYDERKNIPWIINQSSEKDTKKGDILKKAKPSAEYYNHIIEEDYFKYITTLSDKTVEEKRAENHIMEYGTDTEKSTHLAFQTFFKELTVGGTCKTLPSVDNNDIFYNKVLLHSSLPSNCKSGKYIPIDCRINRFNYVANITPRKVKFKSNNIDMLFLTCSDDLEKLNINTQDHMNCSFKNLLHEDFKSGTLLNKDFGRFTCNEQLIPSVKFINQIIDF